MMEKKNKETEFNQFWEQHHKQLILNAPKELSTVSRMEIRQIVNDYMTTVMHEEPLDPTLLEFDDSMTW